MTVGDAELQGMWDEVLRLSRVRAGEAVAVLTGPDSNPRYVRAAACAAQGLGAACCRIDLPQGGAAPLGGNAPAFEALKRADMVVDLMFLLHSPEQEEILAAGTRMLLAVEPPEILARMLPTDDDRRRVKAASAVLRKGRAFRAVSAAGTDLACRIGGYPVLEEYGFADEPGRWDHWPSGFLATWPDEGSANGVVVLDAGDIVFPFKSYVRDPVSLTIKDGYVTRIEGGLDAAYLEDYMRGYDDPEAFAVSHLGWGLQPKARWTTLGLYDKAASIGMDGRAFYGNFLFSTGPNTEGGGTRTTACHIDFPMRNCSVSVDGKPMTRNGAVVPEDQRAGA